MKEFIRDKNTYILIFVVIIFSIYNFLTWEQLSIVQKFVVAFAVFAALHEIEEKVWPAGFCELMLKKLGANTQDPNVYMATLPVTICWIVILGTIYFLHSYAFLLVILIALSFMEAFVHTVGIKVHNMKMPYTPGLITAWGMAIVAIVAIRHLASHGLVHVEGYILGTVMMFASFAIMGYFVYKPTGVNPMNMAKEVLAKKRNSNI